MEEANQKGQQDFMKELSAENEQLYHQFNHLLIRNHQLLKRIDDQQQIINDLHVRIEELNMVNSNLVKLNHHIRGTYDNRNLAAGMLSSESSPADNELEGIDLEELYRKWKEYPGQEAKNAPNLRKQVLMLAHLYVNKSLKASDLFYKSGIGAVTGARYVATLKKFGLIKYTGARKKGHYVITDEGKEFINMKYTPVRSEEPGYSANTENTLYKGIPLEEEYKIPIVGSMDHFDL